MNGVWAKEYCDLCRRKVTVRQVYVGDDLVECLWRLEGHIDWRDPLQYVQVPT